MYILFSIFVVILLLFFVINHHRKKKIIRKICSMSLQDKCCTLNAVIAPMGFSYLADRDIFTSTHDAWQRQLGYQSLYNRGAAHFNMVFDYQPVYFNYSGRTWMIQLWKGQYGINTGCEIGVYYAESIVPASQYSSTLFQAVCDDDMLKMSMKLKRNGTTDFLVSCRHWWLTGFKMGEFSWPHNLSLDATITFPNCTMMNAFIEGLMRYPYSRCDITICGLTLTFNMHPLRKHKNCLQKFAIHFSQWKNRWFCRIFLFVTRPFCLSLDRLLYLYYFLPFAFRKTMYVRCYKRKYIRRCGCRRK